MSIRRFQIVLAGLCFGLLPLSAKAASPGSGTLSPDTRTLSAQGGPYTTSNPSGSTGTPNCTGKSPFVCDNVQLTLNVSQDWRSANPGAQLDVALNGSKGDDNYDLYVQDSQGNTLASSKNAKGQDSLSFSLGSVPSQLKVVVVPTVASGSRYTLGMSLSGLDRNPAGAAVGNSADDACSGSTSTSKGSAASVDPGVLADWQGLADTSPYAAFVQFGSGTAAEQDALLARLGLTVAADFRRYSRSVFASGNVAAFRALSLQTLVARIEYNQPLKLAGYTGAWTTRARYAQEAVSGGPYLDASGNALTGKGVTVGLIDSGLYGSHPDFAGRVSHQYKLVVSSTQPAYFNEVAPTADTESSKGGHGTHVSGIMVGGGQSSDGKYPVPGSAPAVAGSFAGAAPDANLAVWAIGAEGLSLYDPALAFRHLLDHLDDFRPALRAVNNSYLDYGGANYDASGTLSCLVKAAVKRNVVVLFAAGNDGGDGSSDKTSGYCKDPTPGVICVASVTDGGTGSRTLGLAAGSARGRQGQPETYPDIAAPGENITSTCMESQADQAVCTHGETTDSETRWQPWYGTISGTSMATPQVTGAVAQLLQARPDLTPAQVEALLQNSALKVGKGYEADPQNPGGTVNVGFGAGLLDVAAALDAAGVGKRGLPAANAEWTVFESDADNAIAPAADARSLTLQNATVNGVAGVMARITLANAGDFGSESTLSYALTLNANGRPASVTISADARGIRSAGTASSAAREGNVLRFFVPLSQLAGAVPGEVLHNIRVLVSNASGVLDYAPSPAGGRAASDADNPMFGRAFTVQSVAEAPANSSPTSAPGGNTVDNPPAVGSPTPAPTPTSQPAAAASGSGGGGSAGGLLALGLLAGVCRRRRARGAAC